MGAIFGSNAEATPAAPVSPGHQGQPLGVALRAGGTVASGNAAASVDVAPILDRAIAKWREARMENVHCGSDESARDRFQSYGPQGAAQELGYSGDTNDSASMNVWLHKQVMAKLAANGGKLPSEIKHA